MISVNVSGKKKSLDIVFDVPIPSLFENHGELQLFLRSLKESADLRLRRTEDKSIAAFTITVSEWLDFVKAVAPAREHAFHQKMIDSLLGQERKELGDGLAVNFHQRSFDTPERYWNFILKQGNFTDYFLNRFTWYLCPKHTIVSPFPLHVDLEASSTCNMNCPMCYRGMLKEVGHMDMELFKKAIDECAEHNVFSVRLSWRGETLTHPQIKEMIAYATKRIRNVSFLTNAFFLSEDMIESLIETKLSYVAVSFDGIRDIYEKIRHPAKFEENYQRLALLKKKRLERGVDAPQVRLCTIWPAIREEPDRYYQAMKEVSDYIVCNPYINFRGPLDIKHDFICQYPWERIVVAYSGKAQCCTGWNADDIILGNVKDTTISMMWQSDHMNSVRKIHAEGRRMSLSSCSLCRHGTKGDPNIKIENIIDRKF